MTGYRHVAANNCCSDLMEYARQPERTQPNAMPIITYAGAMNQHLQGETLKVLASAVSELNAEGTRVQLHIYTPWEFAPDANSIAVPNAVFYKGQVGREQLADIYRRADFPRDDGDVPGVEHLTVPPFAVDEAVRVPVRRQARDLDGTSRLAPARVRAGQRLRVFDPDGRELLARADQGAAAPDSGERTVGCSTASAGTIGRSGSGPTTST